jgi:hypothetical protein
MTEPQYRQCALRVHGVIEQELKVARRDGRASLKKQAVARAAVRLSISERSARRWFAVARADYVYVSELPDGFMTEFGALLRKLRDGVSGVATY